MTETSDVPMEAVEASEPARTVRFRNYVPFDSSLVLSAASSTQSGSDAENANGEEEKSELEKELDACGNGEELNVVPKKANWDLKNMVADRLEKLRRRTERAVVDILREKLKQEQEQEQGESNEQLN